MQEGYTHKTHKILVVDDIELNRTLLKFHLIQSGYDVIEAESGIQAIEKANAEKPDLILMDIMMPEMDGLEATRRLKADLRTVMIPIVVVTALTEMDDKIRALDSGADDFLTKPINDVELLARVKSTVRIKTKQEEIDMLKRDFVSMLVHDLRSPMASILGFAEMLSGDLPDDQRKEYTSIILESGAKMLSLINDILDVSKLEAGQMVLNKTRIDLRHLLMHTLSVAGVLANNKGVKIQTDLAEHLAANLDNEKMGQMILNFLSNAIKFTAKGGTVRIGLVKDESSANKARITIADTGIGIAEAEIPFIFEKYKQASSSRRVKEKGTGLGLPIAKMIADAHNIELSVTSKLGEGTTFELLIELVAEPVPAT
jgi:signal transduction histidine kinase